MGGVYPVYPDACLLPTRFNMRLQAVHGEPLTSRSGRRTGQWVLWTAHSAGTTTLIERPATAALKSKNSLGSVADGDNPCKMSLNTQLPFKRCVRMRRHPLDLSQAN